MNLIVYPDTNYNTYISLIDAEASASDYLFYPQWAELDEDTQSRYLLHAFRIIYDLNGFVGPVPPADAGSLPTAQLQVALNDIVHGLSMSTEVTQQVKREKAGPVEMEYYENPTGVYSASAIPTVTHKCLKSFGWVGTQSLPGLGSIRKIR